MKSQLQTIVGLPLEMNYVLTLCWSEMHRKRMKLKVLILHIRVAHLDCNTHTRAILQVTVRVFTVRTHFVHQHVSN